MMRLVKLLLLQCFLVHVQSNVPYAILHVGPPKTSSSWIQIIMATEISQEMKARNYFLVPRKSYDAFGKEASAAEFCRCINPTIKTSNLVCDVVLREIKDEVHNHLIEEKNIIISSEGFANENIDYSILFPILEGFKVRVLLVYRECVSIMLSMHNQIAKYNDAEPEVKNLFTNHVYFSKRLNNVGATKVLERLLPFVNLTQIYIYDFYGIMQSGSDIVDAMIRTSMPGFTPLDLLKISEKINMLKETEKVNAHVDIRLFQLKWIIEKENNITINRNQMDCFAEEMTEPKCDQDTKNCTVSLLDQLPLSCVTIDDLNYLKQISIEEDVKLRKLYHDRVFYGNETENLKVINSFSNPSLKNQLCEIDEKMFKAMDAKRKIVFDRFDRCF